MFLKISQSSQRNLSQDDGELIALNHLLFYQNFFPLLHYVLSGSLSLTRSESVESAACSKCGEWLSRLWPNSCGGMTGRIHCIVLALFPIVLHFVASCQTISRVRSEPVKVLLACNQPSSQNCQGWIDGHYTCYGQTNRSISSFTQAQERLIKYHIERWEDIWENLPAMLWLRCSGVPGVGCDKWLAPGDNVAPPGHIPGFVPARCSPGHNNAPVTQFKRNNFTTKH